MPSDLMPPEPAPALEEKKQFADADLTARQNPAIQGGQPGDAVIPVDPSAPNAWEDANTVPPEQNPYIAAFQQHVDHPIETMVNPYIDAFQKHIGKPLVDAYVNQSGVGSSPTAELLTRDMAEGITGEPASKGMGDDKYIASQKALGGPGSVPGAMLETAASMVPEIGTMAAMPAANIGIEAKALGRAAEWGVSELYTPKVFKLISTAGKLGDAAAVGAQQGGLQSLLTKQDIGEGALAGAEMGVGFHLLPHAGQAAQSLFGMLKDAGKYGPDLIGTEAKLMMHETAQGMQELARELNALKIPEGSRLPSAASPTVALVERGANGKMVAKVFGLGKKPQAQEMPLDSSTAIKEFMALRERHGLAVFGNNAEWVGAPDSLKSAVFGKRAGMAKAEKLFDPVEGVGANQPHIIVETKNGVRMIPTERPKTGGSAVLPGDRVQVLNPDGSTFTATYERQTNSGKAEVTHTPSKVVTPYGTYDAPSNKSVLTPKPKKLMVEMHQVIPAAEPQPGDFAENFRQQEKTGNQPDISRDPTQQGVPDFMQPAAETPADQTATVMRPGETNTAPLTKTEVEGFGEQLDRGRSAVEDALKPSAAERARAAMASLYDPEATQRTGHGASLSTGADEGQFKPPGSDNDIIDVPAKAKKLEALGDKLTSAQIQKELRIGYNDAQVVLKNFKATGRVSLNGTVADPQWEATKTRPPAPVAAPTPSTAGAGQGTPQGKLPSTASWAKPQDTGTPQEVAAGAKTIPPVQELVPPKPPPAPALTPAETPPFLIDALQTAQALDQMSIAKKVLNKQIDARAAQTSIFGANGALAQGKFGQIGKNISSMFLMGHLDQANAPYIRSLISTIRASPGLQKQVTEASVEALRKAAYGTPNGNNAARLGNSLFQSSFDKLIGEWHASPDRSPALMEKLKLDPMWGQVAPMAKQMSDRINLNSQLLSAMGMVDPAKEYARNIGEMENYAAQLYWAKILPKGEWAKYASKQGFLDGAIKEFQDEAKRQGNVISPLEIGERLHGLLIQDDPVGAIKSDTGALGSAGRALLARQKLTPGIQQALGAMDKGLYPMAVSLGKQEALVTMARAWKGIVADPASFSRQMVEGWHQLPDDPLHFAMAAGGWVPPHIWESLAAAPAAINNNAGQLAHLWQMGMSGIRKNLISPLYAGLGPMLHHVAAQVTNSALAGGLDFTRPVESVKAFAQGIQALNEYTKNPFASGPAELVAEMRQLGVPLGGWGYGSMDHVRKQQLKTIQGELMKDQGTDLWSSARAVYNAIGTVKDGVLNAKGTLDHLQNNAYDYFANSIFQAGNYIALRTKFLAQAQKILDGQTYGRFDPRSNPQLAAMLKSNGGDALDAARKLAAVRVQMSVSNPANVSPNVQNTARRLEKWTPIMATPIAEQFRIFGQLGPRMMREPDLAPRLLAHAAVVGAGLYAYRHLSMASNGITEDDLQKTQQAQAMSDQEYRPVTIPTGGRDAQGRIQMADATPWLPLAHLMRGDPRDGIFKNAAMNLLTLPVAYTSADKSLRELAATLHFVHAPADFGPLKEKDMNFAHFVHTMSQAGALPSIGAKVADAMDATEQKQTPWAKPALTTSQAALKAGAGVTLSPYDPQLSPHRALFEIQMRVSDLAKQLRGADTATQQHIQREIRLLQDRAKLIGAHAQSMIPAPAPEQAPKPSGKSENAPIVDFTP